MKVAVISGDGVFSHTMLGAKDLDASVKFYDAALAPLGVRNMGPFGETIYLYGKEKPAFLVGRPGNGEPPVANGVTVGFAAATPADVDAFHKAGLAAGGTCEGAAGPRGHLPGAYAAYLRDPSGNKVCAYAFTDSN
jgi:catechol 2,3-dioxygenase-like lactoylglutathione lyase family enzyme